jgi:type I restriction enzyme R subunit
VLKAPNAAFIGFTGTPLMAGEELTKEVFGDYVSVYNFKESVDDKNTVPLYYENRIPELQLINDSLTEEIAEICDRADLDDDQERKLEREFAHEYHLITREDRLERVGEDIYQVRCNLFHGDKAPHSEIDRVLVHSAFRILLEFLSRCGYMA